MRRMPILKQEKSLDLHLGQHGMDHLQEGSFISDQMSSLTEKPAHNIHLWRAPNEIKSGDNRKTYKQATQENIHM